MPLRFKVKEGQYMIAAANHHTLTFNGQLLGRGFWLYVWEIVTPGRDAYYYVGRTGDSSSLKAQSPFGRMGQHLGSNDKENMLRQHLQGEGIVAETCEFKLVAYGPIMEEATIKDEHRKSRDIIAALEKQLAISLKEAGYNVLNTVRCRKALDRGLWAEVRKSFAKHFNRLASQNGGGKLSP